MRLHFEVVSYSDEHRRMLEHSHYLALPPPGCLFAVEVRATGIGLCDIQVGVGPLLGVVLVGRPIARLLPQDGSMGEITRLVLAPGVPYGSASLLLTFAAGVAARRGMRVLVAYHDRTRHTGCIYRKAGFRKEPTPQTGSGWGNRPGRDRSARPEGVTPKRRWRLDLVA